MSAGPIMAGLRGLCAAGVTQHLAAVAALATAGPPLAHAQTRGSAPAGVGPSPWVGQGPYPWRLLHSGATSNTTPSPLSNPQDVTGCCLPCPPGPEPPSAAASPRAGMAVQGAVAAAAAAAAAGPTPQWLRPPFPGQPSSSSSSATTAAASTTGRGDTPAGLATTTSATGAGGGGAGGGGGGSHSFACWQARAHAASTPPQMPMPSPTAPTAPPAQLPSRRQLSVQPEAAVYSGPSPRGPSRVTLRTIRKKYESGEPLTMVTAYDYPSAAHVEAAGIDILLVGDSVAMVVHGHDTTLPIRMEEMIAHCKAVARGARRAFLVGDLPFGCYETDARDAVRSAVTMLKEGGMDAVKLEGGSPARVEAARAIVETGVAVMGHVGLTPQSVSVIGGFRPQAQVAEEALRVLDQAQALQKAGCFALVLECIPGPIAAAITSTLTIPTIGIGAGGQCSGQVLVYHDLLGMMSHPHHAKVTPKFCKQYAHVGEIIGSALQQYRQEVEDRTFPGPRFSPYKISDHEVGLLAEALRSRGLGPAAEAVLAESHKAAEAKAAAAAAAAAGGVGGGGAKR